MRRGRPKKAKSRKRQEEEAKKKRPPQFAVLRKLEALGLGAKNVKLGRGMIVKGSLLSEALMNGKKITFREESKKGKKKLVGYLSDEGIDPRELEIQPYYKGGVRLEMTETLVGRLTARGILDVDEFDAGTWFRDKHRMAFGIPESKTSKSERIDGAVAEQLSVRSIEAQGKMIELAGEMREQGKSHSYSALVTYVSHEREPVSKYEFALIKKALGDLMVLKNWRRRPK